MTATETRIRDALRAALAPKTAGGSERIATLLLARHVDNLLAALDAAGLEIREKG